MEEWAYTAMIVGALVIGFTVEYLVRQRVAYEWALAAAGALVGAYAGSELLGSLSDWGTEWQGMRIVPALIGGIVVGVVVEAIQVLIQSAGTGERPHTPA